MIIVEGPDGSGKTTLIKQLQERYPDLEIAPRVVSQQAQEMTDLQVWVNENLMQGFQYKIFDRHRLISEFIYGPVLRNQMRPGFTNWQWVSWSLRRFYREVDPIIIYCLPPLYVVKLNIVDDPDNEVVWDHIEAIYTGYLQRAAIDATQHEKTLIWDYTLDYIVEQNAGKDPLQFFDPYINYAKGRAEL